MCIAVHNTTCRANKGNGTYGILQNTPLKVLAWQLATLQAAEAIVAEQEEQTEEVLMPPLPDAAKADIRKTACRS